MNEISHTYSALLRSIPFFSRLSGDHSVQLAQLLEPQSVPFDTVLFHRGDPGDSMYIIAEGEVELFIEETTGEKISLLIARPGDFFGELSLLDSGSRTASARALADVTVLKLSQKNLMRFLESHPVAMFELLRVITARLRNANDMIQTRTAKNSNQVLETKLTRLQRLTARASEFSGSVAFLFLNAIFFISWIVINSGSFSIPVFDPYPYGGLAFFVSIEAIFLSIIVLCAQNLQAAAEKVRNDIEYETNVKAELEVVHLHKRIEHLQQEVLGRLHRIENKIAS